MRNVCLILAASIVSVALSLPATAGPIVATKTQGYGQSAKAIVAARRDRAAVESSELQMIQLQSVMSQRQQALQTTQRIAQSTEDARRQALKNCPSCFR